jgi:hypothetical protein
MRSLISPYGLLNRALGEGKSLSLQAMVFPGRLSR